MVRRLWLLLPALSLYAADIGLTLAGQPAAYWGGDYSHAAERNPLAHLILSRHPTWFVAAAIGWAVAFSAVVVLWRSRVSDWVAVLLAVGHAIGGSTWLARHGPGGWVSAVIYLALAAWLAGACWRRAGLGQGTHAEPGDAADRRLMDGS